MEELFDDKVTKSIKLPASIWEDLLILTQSVLPILKKATKQKLKTKEKLKKFVTKKAKRDMNIKKLRV